MDLTVVSDSTATLHSLTAKNPECELYINRAKQMISQHQLKGHNVSFVWAPSHVGIKGNERADELARAGAQREEVQYVAPMPITTLKKAAGHVINRRTKDCP